MPSSEPSSATTHAVCYQISTVLSTTMMYPMDLVKSRIMSQNGSHTRAYYGSSLNYAGAFSAMQKIGSNEGFFSLFRGVNFAIYAAMLSSMTYMYCYQRALENAFDKTSLPAMYAASFSASVVSIVTTHPIWLLKTRTQLQEISHPPAKTPSLWSLFLSTVRTEGPKGLYKGIQAQICTAVIHASYLPFYLALKQTVQPAEHRISFHSADLLVCLLCTLLAKFTLVILSNPFLVMQTKLQDKRSCQSQPMYRSLRSTLFSVVRTEGITNGLLRRGLAANLLFELPRSTARILLYEIFLSFALR
ncbi:transporter protein [Perkinsela sp. CCAP 1560/4]|nr:transporter protein [Perkinsela sp. CCAP 1560/4]|eukprot:KNH09355.1 transporter protein [Perkinsela sp. CCAP 1560/4]